jgi:antitoxin (DNA-binding transcriptional repressor) of toxin-antitoxin stability system
MSPRGQTEQVGVRELRDQLSRYLDRVRHGEEIEVTDRGKPVAMPVPLPDSRAKLAELVAAGVVTPAAREWTGAPERPPVPEGERAASELLDKQRADPG